MFKVRSHNTTDIAKTRLKMPIVNVTTTNPVFPIADYWNIGGWCTHLEGLSYFYENIYNFEVRDDDVFVVTFPKSGTTWIQEAAWLLLNNLDFDTAKQILNVRRSTYLEMSALLNDRTGKSVIEANELKSPRLIKSHLPLHMLPQQIWQKKTKLIFCVRNPKDVVVSFYYYSTGLKYWQGNIDDFVVDFINDDLWCTPYWPRVLDFWRMRHETNVFFTSYEDMKRNMRSVVSRLNTFLGNSTLKTEEMDKLLVYLSFESMKKNDAANPTALVKKHFNSADDYEFIRRGIIGAYKDELSKENQQKIEKWSEKYLKAAGLTMADIFGIF